MRNTLTIPQPKKDVEELDNDMLLELVALKKNVGFGAVATLVRQFIRRRTDDLLSTVEGRKYEDVGIALAGISQMSVALEYFLDTPLRAEEELKKRNAEKSQ